MLENFRIDDKVAIVTAAGRGIGAATARALAEAGADVVIGARTEAHLREVAADVAKLGRRAEVVPGSLIRREGMEQLVDRALSVFGKIDIVVNNAGGSAPGAFLDTSERSFNKAFEWNVTTAFNLSQLATPHILKAGGGAIINIASAAGRFADRGFAAYGTAKAALCHLTRNLAADLAPKIRVNAVAPGSIATDALESLLDDELRKKMVDGTPLRRLGRVEDIAAAVLYLASPAGSYVTGRILEVDGGLQQSNLDTDIPDLD
ncbi:MAG: SDR family oxidoreductase [Deltaproteobacteria bacterium]|nr:SDR family oxidoreductase [Deltaproteobacteria bacterium]